MLDRLSGSIRRHRRLVIGVWLVLTLFGGFATAQVADRWTEDFSIPGSAAYESSQRAFDRLGTGELDPFVAVLRTDGDITKVAGVESAVRKAAAVVPGARVSSYFDRADDTYLSPDRTTMFALIYPPGRTAASGGPPDEPTRTALRAAAPAGVEASLTGTLPLYAEASGGETDGPSVLIETIIGGLGALVILLFTFGTLPAIAMPLVVAIASILNTFSVIWGLTYIMDVSIVVQFLVALVGLGVAIDYALLMIFRFRDELRRGADRDRAIQETMRHAGHSVIISGSTVAVGLLSMLIVPLPFTRSIAVGGMLIPLISVVASITLLPALLYSLGERVNRLRVLPRRLVDASDNASGGFWNRWSRTVMRRPIRVAAVSGLIIAVLVGFGLQLNIGEPQAKDLPGAGPAHSGYQTLVASGITPGALKPLRIVVEGPAASDDLAALAERVAETPGIAGAAVAPRSAASGVALVEAFPTTDGSAKETTPAIRALTDGVLPAFGRDLPAGTRVTLSGTPVIERDFAKAAYGSFGWVLLFVLVLTYVLLARAFRSLILPLKAVILNLVSLAGAYGVIVLVFQMGHGSEAIWNVAATGAISPWVPLMIFAFLYGLSMDYEVFMLSRMREAYDQTGDTSAAVGLGLARTGKLITSAALVLMFAFLVLSLSPGVEIKPFGIGLAAGIILDATLIRALLVPATMRLMGRWNWWMPAPAARLLRLPVGPEPRAQAATAR